MWGCGAHVQYTREEFESAVMRSMKNGCHLLKVLWLGGELECCNCTTRNFKSLFSSGIWSVLYLFVCMDTMGVIWVCNLFIASYWLFCYGISS